MLDQATSGILSFTPRARLLRLIGAELISDDVVAITELVKNAHDADATSVVITFRTLPESGGELLISDNGAGMNLEILLSRWMQPASSEKRDQKSRRTLRGRRVLGEKGVGRFAADKLAAHLELISRRSGTDQEIRAVFNWNDFDADHLLLSDIKSAWEVRPAREIQSSGTILRLTGLRSSWTERSFRRLSTRLARLISPFGARDGFAIRIESDVFASYAGDLRPSFLDRAPYSVEASFDGFQDVLVAVNGRPPVKHRWNGQAPLACGPVKTHLFAFDLETESIARIGPRIDVRSWLREWSGISVYRDGFRIWPYGEPHDDWLRLDQRRVNNPVVRLSNNQVVGFVEISGDGNPELRDQTNREGLIANPALDDLRALMSFAMQILEAERQSVRHPLSTARAGRLSPKATTAEAWHVELERLAKKAPPELGVELRRLVEKMRKGREAEDVSQRRLLDGYSDLAALGQAAIGTQAAIDPLIESMKGQCVELRALLNGTGTREIKDSIETIQELIRVASQRLSMLTPLETGISRRRRNIDVPDELEAVRDVLTPLLEEAEVDMFVDAPERGVLRAEMRPETFARLLHILAMNSLDWMKGRPDRWIRLQAKAVGEECHILFSDSGPGIQTELIERVFEPTFSTKDGGRGMGLTIARHLVTLHGGRIEIDTDQRRRGANIRIILPRKKSRATV